MLIPKKWHNMQRRKASSDCGASHDAVQSGSLCDKKLHHNELV